MSKIYGLFPKESERVGEKKIHRNTGQCDNLHGEAIKRYSQRRWERRPLYAVEFSGNFKNPNDLVS